MIKYCQFFMGAMVILALSGCGMKPLYGPHSALGSSAVQDRIDTILIAKLPRREGQILRNFLLDKLNPSGEPLSPDLYLDLDIKLEKEVTSLRRDGTSQRYNTTATVDVRLYRIDPTHPDRHLKTNLVYEDSVVRTTSYSIGRSATEPGYPGTVADKHSRKTVLKLVADDIQLMLATYLLKWGDQS